MDIINTSTWRALIVTEGIVAPTSQATSTVNYSTLFWLNVQLFFFSGKNKINIF